MLVSEKWSKLSDASLKSYGNWIDPESLNELWTEVCEWYDENIDLFVKNISQIYNLTDGEWGYSALTQDWTKWEKIKDQQRKKRYDDDFIKKHIMDKIYRPLSWLAARSDYESTNREFREGMTGLMITFSLNVIKGYDSDDFKYSWNYNLSINIGAGNHGGVRKIKV